MLFIRSYRRKYCMHKLTLHKQTNQHTNVQTHRHFISVFLNHPTIIVTFISACLGYGITYYLPCQTIFRLVTIILIQTEQNKPFIQSSKQLQLSVQPKCMSRDCCFLCGFHWLTADWQKTNKQKNSHSRSTHGHYRVQTPSTSVTLPFGENQS